MERLKNCCLIGSVLVMILSGVAFATITYYVSPEGNDSNAGTIGSPLKTPTGARNKIRTLSKPLTEWVFVYFREGRYTTLALGVDDGSESETYGIHYLAYEPGGDHAPERVIFDGGVDLDLSSAYLVTDAGWLNRLKASARGYVYCIDSVPASVSDNLSGQSAVVSMDGKLMVSPRWPDLGYAAASGNPVVSGNTTIPILESIPSLVVSEFKRPAGWIEDFEYLSIGTINQTGWRDNVPAVTVVTTSSSGEYNGGQGMKSGSTSDEWPQYATDRSENLGLNIGLYDGIKMGFDFREDNTTLVSCRMHFRDDMTAVYSPAFGLNQGAFVIRSDGEGGTMYTGNSIGSAGASVWEKGDWVRVDIVLTGDSYNYATLTAYNLTKSVDIPTGLANINLGTDPQDHASGWSRLVFRMASSTATYVDNAYIQDYDTAVPSETMYLAGYLYNDWYKELKTVIGLTNSSVTFSGTGYYGTGSGAQIQIVNVLAELDEEGEFYYDKKTGKFFFRPFDDVIYQDSYIAVANSDVITITDCQNVGIRNITIQNGATCGVKFVRGSTNSVTSSTIRNCRIWGVCIGDPYNTDPSYTGTGITIGENDIYDCGNRVYSGGVSLNGGYVSPSAITPAGNMLKNCHIWNIRNIDSGDRGIKALGVGNTVKNNLIHNIQGNCNWGGNDQTIEYNELFGINLEKGDGGALYTARSYWTYGNNVRYNFIHHILTKPGMHSLVGLYYDQGDAGDVSTGNVFYKAGYRAILWNGGAGQSGNGNLFVNCDYGFYNTEAYANGLYASGEVLSYTEAVVGTSGWNYSPWTTYPLFATIMNQAVNRNWPIECSVTNNVYVNMIAADYPQGYYIDENSNRYSYADENGNTVTWSNNQNQSSSILTNLDTLNFAYQNFTPTVTVDFGTIGLYRNTYRDKMPNKDTYRRFIKIMNENKQGYTSGTYSRTVANDYIYYNFKSPMWEVYDGEPMNYAGLVLWLDGADRKTTLNHDWQDGTANNSFKYWIDKSGCGNHFYQLSDGYRPLLNEDQYGINGISSPDFQGADEHMVSDMKLSNTGTMFVVVRHDVDNYDVIFNTDGGDQLQLRDSGNGTTGFKYNSTYSYFSPRPASGTVVIYSVTFQPDLQKWYYNGTLKSTQYVSGFTSNTQSLILGSGNTSGNSSWDGEIAEVILYDRYLGDEAREDIEGYLAYKWQ